MTRKTVQITRRAFSGSLAALPLAAGGLIGLAAPAIGQTKYPNNPVTIVLPFGAGGMADVSTRIVADKIGQKLGQRFVIENKPGAGGITAVRAVTSAPPDGYTLGLATNGTSITVALFKSLPFDVAKQFDTISMVGTFELVLIVAENSPYKTLKDFIDAAKAQPGKLNVGTVNVGSTQNLGAELFKSMAHLNFQIVPHRTTPDLVVGLLRNDIQLVVDFPAAVKGFLNDKKVRALGTSGNKRSVGLPDVPTVAEAGVPGYEVLSWNGFFGPAGMPKDVIETINKAMREVLAEDAVKKRLATLGVEAKASSPEELKKRMLDDVTKWADVIEKAHIPKQ